MRKAILCALMLSCLPVHASAQSAGRAMQAFGLLGTWAGECTQGPSPANNHAIYAVTSSGEAQMRNTFGEEYEESVYNIVDARPTVPGKFSLRMVLASDETIVLDVILMKENGKIRIWSSQTGDGKLLVKEGVIAGPNNRETRWVTHCD